MNGDASTSHRLWATVSIISALLWIIFSALLPTPFTTVLGLPFAGVALLSGWFSRRRSLQLSEPAPARRAGWGMGLTCAGCVWQVIYLSVMGGIGLSLLAAVITAAIHAMQGTPVP